MAYDNLSEMCLCKFIDQNAKLQNYKYVSLNQGNANIIKTTIQHLQQSFQTTTTTWTYNCFDSYQNIISNNVSFSNAKFMQL